ncbi:unnamed protein product [Pylaiella littoralis]
MLCDIMGLFWQYGGCSRLQEAWMVGMRWRKCPLPSSSARSTVVYPRRPGRRPEGVGTWQRSPIDGDSSGEGRLVLLYSVFVVVALLEHHSKSFIRIAWVRVVRGGPFSCWKQLRPEELGGLLIYVNYCHIFAPPSCKLRKIQFFYLFANSRLVGTYPPPTLRVCVCVSRDLAAVSDGASSETS